MTIARALGAVVVALGVAVGTASPASAVEEPMYGIYTYHQEGMPEAKWTIYATCVVAGCVLHVSSVTSPHLGPNSDDPGYSGDARPVNGLWTLQVQDFDGVKCPDGSTGTSTRTFSWDQATLAGTVTVLHGEVCGLRPAMTKQPFHLTYHSPLPIPIILDPLNQIPELW